MNATQTISPATEKQIAFADKLVSQIAERKLAAGEDGGNVAEWALAMREGYEGRGRKAMSAVIDALIYLRDNLPKTEPKATSGFQITDGFWVADAEGGSVVWKVQQALHSDRLYAKRLDEHTGRFEYVSGGMKILRDFAKAGRLAALTLDKAKELGHLYGRCCVCGRTLTDEDSIEAGIGPVCAAKF